MKFSIVLVLCVSSLFPAWCSSENDTLSSAADENSSSSSGKPSTWPGDKPTFVSAEKVESLLEIEPKVQALLEEFVAREQRRLSKLERMIQKYEAKLTISRQLSPIPSPSGSGGNLYTDNPVNIYVMIKRLVRDWTRLEKLAKRGAVNKNVLLQTFQELLGTTSLPTQKELEAAADAILTIQTVYDLPAKDIAAGNMHPDFPSAELTMTQCAELAQRAAIVTPHLATPWKGAAMEQLLKQKADLLDDEEKKQVQLAARVFNQNPDLFIMKQAHVYAREELEADEDCDEELPEEALQKQQEKETREMFQQYKELCSGQASQAAKSSRLKCRLKGGASTLRTHPSLVLAPAREEELSSSPSILLFHDVLSPKEAQELVEHSRPQMAPLDSNDGIIAMAAMTRSPKLSLRLKQTIEGLPITADEYQILHYGLSGVDASGKIEVDDLHSPSRSIFHVGNASTGMILYLGDVAIGGETVFPKLGVVVPAIQGSVLFWENRDPRTPHALCPVVVGDHWELQNLSTELQK